LNAVYSNTKQAFIKKPLLEHIFVEYSSLSHKAKKFSRTFASKKTKDLKNASLQEVRILNSSCLFLFKRLHFAYGDYSDV